MTPVKLMVELEDFRANVPEINGKRQAIPIRVGGVTWPCVFSAISALVDRFLMAQHDQSIICQMKSFYEVISGSAIELDQVTVVDPNKQLKNLFKEIQRLLEDNISCTVGGEPVSCLKSTIRAIWEGYRCTLGRQENTYWQDQIRNVYEIFNLSNSEQ
ncbi:hypothetical protein H8S90_21265 [Olivibacter sp. SDN3]|uniref:hypothetical protein n=1 Tax=Olivibacter sp. SDN3 TaxID=2764720 RepID=UPI0016519F0F|nr:hypothetical protein [Olivibacter sp. SDN3]QNL49242.1 hypothetical protein H8S90_21265 [Olivibacter sp. SDN3]